MGKPGRQEAKAEAEKVNLLAKEESTPKVKILSNGMFC